MGREILDLPAPAADARLHYGPDAFQFGDLRVPEGPGPHPVAIVIHGGFWRARYGLEYMGHMCEALKRAGIATWNVEYRRIGNPGGGWPGTFLDVAAGADFARRLAEKHHLDAAKSIAIGHSAGGHLAVWLAARRRLPAGSALEIADPLVLHGAVPLAGVVDLRRGWELRLSDGAVGELIGGPPEKFPDRYRAASPIELVPLGVKVRLLHGTEDSVVPIEISNNYQKAASGAGDDARMIVLPGADHFAPVDPRSQHWAKVEAAVSSYWR
jgi:acetyl esterase/lipase